MMTTTILWLASLLDIVSSFSTSHRYGSTVATASTTKTTAFKLQMALGYGDDEEDAGLGAAKALLFSDQHKAMSDRAEVEASIIQNTMVEMDMPDVTAKARTKAQRGRGSSGGMGGGFGGGKTKTKTKKNKKANAEPVKKPKRPISTETKRLVNAMKEDGVVRIRSAIQPDVASSLREAVMTELELMRDDIRQDPSLSVPYFYVPAEIHFSSSRGYILLPFRDRNSAADSQDAKIVSATQQLLGRGSALGDLFGELCGGPDVAELYDFCSLRTEAGTNRQLIHSDTPYQDPPGLFCAFVALQDVEVPMGGTLFFPGTQVQTDERLQFDVGGSAAEDMLANSSPRCVHMKAGDAAVFDMRILHAGLPNLAEGGSQRILLAVTFRNPAATQDLGHRPNLRPGYIGRYTLDTFQDELETKSPFAHVGNGAM